MLACGATADFWAGRQANAIVLLGDEDEFGLTTMALAEKLARAGYELAPE